MALHAALGSLSLGGGCQQPVVRTGFYLLLHVWTSCAFAHVGWQFVTFWSTLQVKLPQDSKKQLVVWGAQTLRRFEGFRAAGAPQCAQLVAARSSQVPRYELLRYCCGIF